MLPLSELSLSLNIAVFALSAILVWFAGAQLTTYADTISNATGGGQAVVGIVLLAGVTSLPEIGVTAAASLAGEAQLAANNMFGSIALTSLFLIGRAERRDRTLWRMGYDSIFVVLTYGGGVVLLYTMRDAA